MKATGWTGKITLLIVCVFAALAVLFLTGANSIPQIGRYQMECIERRGFTEIYVVDTTNGVVKWIDKTDEGKPFSEIKIK